eukprot:CAMPEP_0115418104 /NCGR_PEP_ID=MMETSP0271-20121206/24481_1 /TAXON_ID=71861 /ORGANISM="Scrippsiella trochoidea, Strain CCMP3099" /LENGTH=56 /DNA_ID=CAMNT_0002842539 /DNA_START=52 /DNA_END=219 /DNA_ORIENTATION=-
MLHGEMQITTLREAEAINGRQQCFPKQPHPPCVPQYRWPRPAEGSGGSGANGARGG